MKRKAISRKPLPHMLCARCGAKVPRDAYYCKKCEAVVDATVAPGMKLEDTRLLSRLIASWRHIGYIMLLYLAGMKAFDGSLREAAAIDGCSDWYTFRKVVIPTLRPVNVIIVVVTIIESLRAFDLVYIINQGTNGLQTLGVLVYDNILGSSMRIGWGAAYATLLFLICLGPITVYLYQNFSRED